MGALCYPLNLKDPPKPSRDDFLIRPGFYAATRYNPEGRHLAADLPAKEGVDLLAILPGEISYAGEFGALGKAVALVDDRYGYEWWFGHLSRIRARTGAEVERREHLGDVGETGRANGPHVHIAIYAEPLRGRAWGSVPFIDPYPFLLEAWIDRKDA